jgi:hypothetical protein
MTATNRSYAQFSEEETTRAAYDTFEGYARRHKLPVGLYVDRDSIYQTERELSVAEQVSRGEAADPVWPSDEAVGSKDRVGLFCAG